MILHLYVLYGGTSPLSTVITIREEVGADESVTNDNHPPPFAGFKYQARARTSTVHADK